MLLASGSQEDNDTNNPQENMSPEQGNNTNNPQENLSPEQEKAQKELSEAKEELDDLTKEKEQVQRVYDKHNKGHAHAQDASDSEAEEIELGFLEEYKPYLDELEEKLESAQEHVQTLTDVLNSLF